MRNTNIEKLRVFEAFSGYGSQSIALRNTRRGIVQEEGKICHTIMAFSQEICYVERTPLKFLG